MSSKIIKDYAVEKENLILDFQFSPTVKLPKGENFAESKHTSVQHFETEAQKFITEAQQQLTEANLKAQKILADAEQNSKQILADASASGQKNGYADGYNKGMSEGYAQGLEKAQGELKDAQERMEVMLASAQNTLVEEIANNEKEIIKLALKIAEKILGKEIELSTESVIALAEEAVKQVKEENDFVIYVSSYDYAQREIFQKLREQAAIGKQIHLIEDKKLKKGECIVETRDASVSCLIDERMEKLKNILFAGDQNDSGN